MLRFHSALIVILTCCCTTFVPVKAQQPKKSETEQPKLEGHWLGKLDVGIVKLRLVVNLKKDDKGKYTGTMDSPDQGAKDMKIDAVTYEKGKVKIEWKKLLATFDGEMKEGGAEMKGEWKQGKLSFPITFKRLKGKLVVRRPQTPKKPYPYESEDVMFENKKADVKLAGTLTWPKGEGPFPAVVLISGSGPQDRDESMMGHKPFLVLADHLTRQGIAVLRYDDRGVGGSTGKTMASTIEDNMGDTLAAVKFLKKQKQIDARRIGLVGHSEGGLVSPLAASRSKDVAFIVLLAGTGLPGDEILRLQGQAIVKSMGGGEKELKMQAKLQKRIFQIVRKEKDNAKVKKAMTKIFEDVVADLPEDERKAFEAQKPIVEAQIKMVTTPWFRHFLDYDPRIALRKVQCPVLVMIGSLDVQVLPRENLKAIATCLAEGGNKDFAIREMPKLNHIFQTAKTGSIAEYSQIEETFAPVALRAVSNWIRARTLDK